MTLALYFAVAFLGLSSYAIGVWKMIQNKYAPSFFSRIVWLLLTINSFAGMVLCHSSSSSILLGVITLIGSLAICIGSAYKGTRSFGNLEYLCIALLILSVIIWIFSNAPLINLIISLVAHFIGAAPTYKKLWASPESEDIPFWLLFFLASLLSVFISDSFSLKAIIFPAYCTLFDGSILLLALRRFKYLKPTFYLAREPE